MNLIARRKKQHPVQQGLGHLRLVLKALIAQRVARNAYSGYKWARRAPYILGGAAVVAFVVRKTQQKSGGAADAGYTPSTSSTSGPGTPEPAASTPSTPTPTGSPTAVTPAPTAAADGAPEADDKDAGSKS